MISVLYNTIRPGGIDILKDNLERQTYQDFELVFVDAYKDRYEIVNALFDNVTYLPGLPKGEDDVWTLNKDYNLGLHYCTGDLVVFLQDYIRIGDDTLETFAQRYEENPSAFVSTSGHNALKPLRKDREEGLYSVFDEFQEPKGISRKDRRVKDNGFEKYNYTAWEMNCASAPRRILNEIGGFDEDMDKYFSGDNVVLAYKAYKIGCEFYIDHSIELLGYNQEALFGRPEGWEEKHSNKNGILASKTS